MSDAGKELDISFFQLVLSLQAAAWQQMGKVASPITGKVERDLDQAKVSIDILNMMQKKTKGNLTPQEQKLIDDTLHDLHLNFVDEVKKGREEPADTKKPEEKETSDTEPSGETDNRDEAGSSSEGPGAPEDGPGLSSAHFRIFGPSDGKHPAGLHAGGARRP